MLSWVTRGESEGCEEHRVTDRACIERETASGSADGHGCLWRHVAGWSLSSDSPVIDLAEGAGSDMSSGGGNNGGGNRDQG